VQALNISLSLFTGIEHPPGVCLEQIWLYHTFSGSKFHIFLLAKLNVTHFLPLKPDISFDLQMVHSAFPDFSK